MNIAPDPRDLVEIEGPNGEAIRVVWPRCASIGCRRRATPPNQPLCPIHSGTAADRPGAQYGPYLNPF